MNYKYKLSDFFTDDFTVTDLTPQEAIGNCNSKLYMLHMGLDNAKSNYINAIMSGKGNDSLLRLEKLTKELIETIADYEATKLWIENIIEPCFYINEGDFDYTE